MNKEYEALKLSDQKKNAMIQALKYGKPLRRKKSYVGIVAPLFVVVAFFLFFISGNEIGLPQQVNSTGVDLSESDHEIYFFDLLILWTVSLVFLMMAYVQFILLALKPERLMEYRVFRTANKAFGTWRVVVIGAVPFVWMIIETLIILFISHELVLQFFIVLLLFLNVILIQLKFVKGRTRATCPHCGVELSNKEVTLNKKCGVCGNGRMRKVQNSFQEIFNYLSWMIAMFFPFFQLSFVYFLFYVVSYAIFTLVYINPYMVVFTKESDIPPPLW